MEELLQDIEWIVRKHEKTQTRQHQLAVCVLCSLLGALNEPGGIEKLSETVVEFSKNQIARLRGH